MDATGEASADRQMVSKSTPFNFFEEILHTGPGTLTGRYLRTFWHPVYLGRDLTAGRAVPIKLMSEEFTLYRGEHGEAHAVAFRCAHRGTQLSTGWVEGDTIRCFYHGWAYDGNGQCVRRPAEPDPFCNRIRIRSYPVEEYLGLIFVYQGEGEPPPRPRFPEADELLASGEGIVRASGGGVPQPSNYFARLDQAFGDNTHTYFAHRESFVLQGGLVGIPVLSAEETEYGAIVRNKRDNGIEGASHYTMPNLNMFSTPPRSPDIAWQATLAWRIPVDDEHWIGYLVNLTRVKGGAEAKQRLLERPVFSGGPYLVDGQELTMEQLGEEILAGRKCWHDFTEAERANMIGVQDYVTVIGQGVYAPEPRITWAAAMWAWRWCARSGSGSCARWRRADH